MTLDIEALKIKIRQHKGFASMVISPGELAELVERASEVDGINNRISYLISERNKFGDEYLLKIKEINRMKDFLDLLKPYLREKMENSDHIAPLLIEKIDQGFEADQ